MIRGERTNLRAVERHDDGHIFQLLNDEETMLGWGMAGDIRSLARVQAEIEGWLEDERRHGRPTALAIETLDGHFAGVILLRPGRSIQRMVELSLAVAPSERGQGIAPDAIATFLDLAFDEWNLDRVQLRCEAGNAHAVALYEGLGLVREATLRHATYTGGAYTDQYLYARIRSDRL